MGEKKLSKPKTKKQSEENRINSVRNLFMLKKKEKNRLIKDRIIRALLTLFETEEEEKERQKLEKKKRY